MLRAEGVEFLYRMQDTLSKQGVIARVKKMLSCVVDIPEGSR